MMTIFLTYYPTPRSDHSYNWMFVFQIKFKSINMAANIQIFEFCITKRKFEMKWTRINLTNEVLRLSHMIYDDVISMESELKCIRIVRNTEQLNFSTHKGYGDCENRFRVVCKKCNLKETFDRCSDFCSCSFEEWFNEIVRGRRFVVEWGTVCDRWRSKCVRVLESKIWIECRIMNKRTRKWGLTFSKKNYCTKK